MRDEVRKPLVSKGEVLFYLLVVSVVSTACFGLLVNGGAHAETTPKSYLRTVSRYMQVPEPIDLVFWQADYNNFSSFLPKTATVGFNKAEGRWVIVLNEDWWNEAPYHSRLSTLAHEVCHAAYDHDLLMPDLWYEIEPAETKWRQDRALVCASDILRRIQRAS